MTNMEKKKLLLQLDTDPQSSVFDRVVAIDAGAEHIFSHGSVKPDQVQGLVHGCIFTRGPKDLNRTAIFIGGSDVAAGETLLAEVKKHLLPNWGLQVSVLLDSNGCNTTAAAAVRAAARHIALKDAKAVVLGGTGPVGQRVARLLAREGADVVVGSRQAQRAAGVCSNIAALVPGARLTPAGTGTADELTSALAGRQIVVAAGAAGAVLLPKSVRLACASLRIAIDLNAVPPVGVEGVDIGDKAKERDGVICYGAIGVGDTKMKIHRAAIAKLFERNDQIMDAEEVYALAAGV